MQTSVPPSQLIASEVLLVGEMFKLQTVSIPLNHIYLESLLFTFSTFPICLLPSNLVVDEEFEQETFQMKVQHENDLF